MRSIICSPGDGRHILLKILSPQEREVTRLAAGGLKDREIAQRMDISSHTVRRRLTSLFLELEVRNRVELTRWLLAHPGALDGDAVPPGSVVDASFHVKLQVKDPDRHAAD